MGGPELPYFSAAEYIYLLCERDESFFARAYQHARYSLVAWFSGEIFQARLTFRYACHINYVLDFKDTERVLVLILFSGQKKVS